MYVTAQRVEGRAGEGINAFLHEASVPGDVDWDAFDRGDVTLGDVARQSTEVSPGGNAVLSFLDVVSEDAFPAGAVRSLLASTPARRTRRGAWWSDGRLGARFELCGGESHSPDFGEELGALTEALVALLESAGARDPLLIRRHVSSDGIVLELPPETVERLRRRHGSDWRAPRLRVRREVIDEWRQTGLGGVQDQVLRILTGLTDEEIREEGGFRTATSSE